MGPACAGTTAVGFVPRTPEHAHSPLRGNERSWLNGGANLDSSGSSSTSRLAAPADQPATSRAETDAIAAQATRGAVLVGDVLAAKPIGVLFAGGALLRRALRSRGRRRHHQCKAKQTASSHSRRTPITRKHCSHRNPLARCDKVPAAGPLVKPRFARPDAENARAHERVPQTTAPARAPTLIPSSCLCSLASRRQGAGPSLILRG
jgi:hypothetical protein